MQAPVATGSDAASERVVSFWAVPLRRVALLAVSVVAMLVAFACGRESGPGGSGGGTPTPGSSGTPGGTPTPIVGDGRDGSYVLTKTSSWSNCVSLVSASASRLSVTGGFAVTPGDLLLLWQVQASAVAVAGDTAEILTLDTAGRWEVAVVVTATAGGGGPGPGPGPGATSVTIASPVSFAYRSGFTSHAQACRIPQFHTVDIAANGTLGAPNWNGVTGGVVALVVSSSLTVDGTITASNSGFRGATKPFVTGQNGAGVSGEGLDGASRNVAQTANVANAGGGGAIYHCGGGGGGGYGRGGLGGTATTNATPTPIPGKPGAGVATAPARLFMGGGGGSGNNYNNQAGAGGPGGGLVLLFAKTLAGAGGIRADGGAGGNGGTDGGGGGGAGGLVLVYAETSTFTGQAFAHGGNGGTANSQHGPGGGGGGGFVHVALTADRVSIGGGDPGTDGTSALGAETGTNGAFVP